VPPARRYNPTVRTINTDYLVVGAGAAGMAFADALIAACDADVVMVDRRHRPGGHWNDAYPFVRLFASIEPAIAKLETFMAELPPPGRDR
jgi:cation diffusion facilitator CzcD-associated flavoprotein CzcO